MKDNLNNTNNFLSSNQDYEPFIISSTISPGYNSNILYYQHLSNASFPLLNDNLNTQNLYKINVQANNPELLNLPKTPRMTINSQNEIGNSNNFPINKQQNTENNLNEETKYTSVNVEPSIEVFPTINNIVCTVNLGCNLNLKEIAFKAINSEYKPNKFPGILMKIKEPKTIARIFHNGKMICMGAKSEDDSKRACREFCKILKSLNYPIVLTDYKIQNIVGSFNVKFRIPLNLLSNYIIKKVGESMVNYTPELFPGLSYHYISDKKKDSKEKPNIVILVYNSGNIVITGAKESKQIYEAFESFYPFLKIFKSNLDNLKN